MTECGDDCPHVMFRRCPNCRMEMYAPAVWAFSHGEATCQCGHKPEPTVRVPYVAPT